MSAAGGETFRIGHCNVSQEVKMKKWCLIVAVSLFVLCLTAMLSWGEDPAQPSPERDRPDPAFIGGPMGPPGFGPGPAFYPGFEQMLSLTTEQRDKIKKLGDLARQETKDLRYKLAQKHLEFRKLFSDPQVDEKILLDKQKEISALSGELQDKTADTMIKVRRILSPEQIGQLDQMPPPPIQHRMGGKGRGPMEGPCPRRDRGPGPDDGADEPFRPPFR